MPPPPVVESSPGDHFAPSHFNTLPATGVVFTVSTSVRSLIVSVGVVPLIVTVDPDIAVVTFVPPAIVIASVVDAALICPASALTVVNTF